MSFLNSKAQIAATGSPLDLFFLVRGNHSRARYFFIFLILPLLISAAPSTCLAADVLLESDQEISTAGYYQLSWLQGKPGMVLTLEERQDAAAAVSEIYNGMDTATVISGKPDGVYHYTLLSDAGEPVSNTVTVTVKHHSLTIAVNFFLIGALVFVFILIAIIRGSRKLT